MAGLIFLLLKASHVLHWDGQQARILSDSWTYTAQYFKRGISPSLALRPGLIFNNVLKTIYEGINYKQNTAGWLYLVKLD